MAGTCVVVDNKQIFGGSGRSPKAWEVLRMEILVQCGFAVDIHEVAKGKV